MERLRWSFTEAKKHAGEIVRMQTEKRRRLCILAGIDPDYIPHAHNALISYAQGRPWPNVNYSLVRKIRRLDDHMFDANRILERYVRRRDRENPFWIQANQGKFA